jgi:hypothetical protein
MVASLGLLLLSGAKRVQGLHADTHLAGQDQAQASLFSTKSRRPSGRPLVRPGRLVQPQVGGHGPQAQRAATGHRPPQKSRVAEEPEPALVRGPGRQQQGYVGVGGMRASTGRGARGRARLFGNKPVAALSNTGGDNTPTQQGLTARAPSPAPGAAAPAIGHQDLQNRG